MMCIHMRARVHIQSIGHEPAHIAMMFVTVYIGLGRYLCVYTFVNITWSCVRPLMSQHMLNIIGYILQFKKVDVSSCQGSYGPFGWARAITIVCISSCARIPMHAPTNAILTRAFGSARTFCMVASLLAH